MSLPQIKTKIGTERYPDLHPDCPSLRGLITGVAGASPGATQGLQSSRSGTRDAHAPFFFEEEIGISESIG